MSLGGEIALSASLGQLSAVSAQAVSQLPAHGGAETGFDPGSGA
jgi:hypothetical protein